MQALSKRSRSRRWFAPAVLAAAAPLLFMALPGAPAGTLAQYAGNASAFQTESATMNAVQIGFLRAREAERESLPAQPDRYQTAGRAPDAAATDMKVAIDRQFAARSVPEPGGYLVNAVTEMESALGQLQSNDEDLLREPLLGMRLAGAAARTQADPWSARRLAHWAEIFAARLNKIAIPAGTRDRLARALAVYEHEQASIRDAHEVRQDRNMQRFATIAH